MKILSNLLIGLIIGLRPLLGPSPSGFCRYKIGCTEFAINQLENQTLFKAIYLIIKRLFSCNPFNKNYLKFSE